MPDIKATVANKIASIDGAPVIICGNSDYTIIFAFDEEWGDYAVKTARFVYASSGTLQYQDVVFNGNAVSVPVMADVLEVSVGVYAGDLHTTTPARIPCLRSILCTDLVHADPPEDVYNQIMAILESITAGGGGTTNYNLLINKPQINGVELEGNKTAADLGIPWVMGGGIGSAVIGSGCTTSGLYSVVGGKNSACNHDYAMIYGLGLRSSGSYQSIYGMYNAVDPYALLQVGNGTGPDTQYRSNALNLTTDGNLTIAGSLATGDGKVMSDNNYTDADKAKLASITNPISIKGRVDTVDELPSDATVGWLYFVGASGAEEFTEYVYTTDGAWELVGVSTVDLSAYYTADETDAAIESATADKLGRTETAAAAVLDGAGGNIAEQFAEDANDLSIVKTTLGTECKNLLPVNCEPIDRNGVTLTPNDDGSITINGTSSTSTSTIGYCNLRTGSTDINSQYDRYQLLQPGKYIISRTSAPNVRIQVYAMTSDETTSIVNIGNSATSDAVITIGEEHIYTWARLYLANSVSQVYDNITVYPMIRRADVTDSTYEPYKPSLQVQIDELTAMDATINTRTTSIANGYVYSGSTGSNKWYKAAEVSISEAFACRASTFLVSSTTGASCGILSLILVSKSSSDFGINYARAIWSSNNGITASNFVVVAKLVNGIITAELWVKITGAYVSYKFTRLIASERATISGDTGWSLVTSTTGQDNYPTDYDTTFVSTDNNTGYNLKSQITALETSIADVDAQMSTIYGLGTEIPLGSDLNNYTTPGSYYVQTLDISATLINSPATTATFRLEVKYTINTSRCIQMIYLNNTSGAFFMRTYYANKWGSWYKFQGTVVDEINTAS